MFHPGATSEACLDVLKIHYRDYVCHDLCIAAVLASSTTSSMSSNSARLQSYFVINFVE